MMELSGFEFVINSAALCNALIRVFFGLLPFKPSSTSLFKLF
jgi:hypothetical protein